MQKSPNTLTPDELFAQAMADLGQDPSDTEIRLLTSGLRALREAMQKPLNTIEKMAVTSVVAYVAYTNHVTEDTVQRILYSSFGVHDIGALPATRYDEIMRFLIDMKLGQVAN